MSTIDSIITKLQSDSKYSKCDEDTLYDIAYNLYYKNSYQTLITYLSGALDPYLSSIFEGENSIWAEFTYTEIIGMEENGVLIPEEILEWAHSMADSDTTSYQTTSDELTESDLDTEVDDSLAALKKLAKTLIVECEDGENEITNKLEKLDILQKDSTYAKNNAEDTQKTALERMQALIDEWKALEAKITRGDTLSETEQTRYNELAGLLNQENETYQSDINDINIDFDELAQSLNEIDDMSRETSDISLETQAVGTSLGGEEQEHKYTSTGTNQQPNMSLADMASVSKNLAYITLITGQDTYQFTEEVLTTVNEVASIMDLTEEVTEQAKDCTPDTEVSEDATITTINEAFDNAAAETNTTSGISTVNTPSVSAAAPSSATTSIPASGTSSTGDTASVSTVETEETAATDETEETSTEETTDSSEDDLRTQTQERIDSCNSCSDAMTNALGTIDPLKQQVEKIKSESGAKKKLKQAEIAKSMKEYEKLCDKIRNGEELNSKERKQYEKLSDELDTEDSDYVTELDTNINTLNTYVSCLNSAFNIVNQSFETANTAIETGKALALQEYGDKSYLLHSPWARCMNEEEKKTLLYGAAGESLGRDAIDRGELLTQEATDTNTVLTAQIPLSDFAQQEAHSLTQEKSEFVTKVTDITDGIEDTNKSEDSEEDADEDTDSDDNGGGISVDEVLKLTASMLTVIPEETKMIIDNAKRLSQSKDDFDEANAVLKEFEEKEEKEREKEAEEIAALQEKIKAEEQKRQQAHSELQNSNGINFGGVDTGNNESKIHSATASINSYKSQIENIKQTSERNKVTDQKKRIKAVKKLEKILPTNKKATKQAKSDDRKTETAMILSGVLALAGWGLFAYGEALEAEGLALQALGATDIETGMGFLATPFGYSLGMAFIAKGNFEVFMGTAIEAVGIFDSIVGLAGGVCATTGEAVSISADVVIAKTKKSLNKTKNKTEEALAVVTDGLEEETDTSTTTTTAVAATDTISVNAGSKNSMYGTSSESGTTSSSTGTASKTDTASTAATADTTTSAADTTTSDTADTTATDETAVTSTEDTEGNDASSKLADIIKNNAVNNTESTTSDSTGSSSSSSSSSSTEEINANNGKQAASDCEKESDDAKKETQSTEKSTKEMNDTAKDAEKTDKELKKGSKDLEKSIKKDEKKIKENEEQVNKTAQKIDEEQTAVETMQAEAETLTAQDEADSANAANNAPAQDPNDPSGGTMGALAGSAAGGGSQGKNAAKIQELNNQIQQKSSTVTLYSGKLIKFQTASDTITKRMKKKHKTYNKLVKKEQKEKTEQNKTSDKVLKAAEKFEGVSQKIAITGMIVGMTGDIMMKVVLPPWIPVVGAVMSPIGHAAEAVGNYGVAAADICKTAVYAAQGNLMVALISAAMAAMSVVAAVGATKQATAGFQNMGKNIAQAQTRAATVQAGKQAAQELAQEGVETAGKDAFNACANGTADEITQNIASTYLENCAAVGTANAAKGIAKQEMKQVLKQAGNSLLWNAGNIMTTTGLDKVIFGGNSSDNSSKKKKGNYKMSNKVKKIMRKNAKRRKSINKKYG